MGKLLGDAFVRVRPDTSEFGPELQHDAAAAAGPAGAAAGTAYSSTFGAKASGRLSSVFKRVAAIGAAVLTGVAAKQAIDFVRESTAGYREHLKVSALTNQVIKTTASAANISARAVGQLSDALERKTGVDGDVIQSGANMLLTFTNVKNVVGQGNAIFDRAVKTVTDMSVALGQDAKGSAVQLGKALNDPIKGVSALQRVGVAFTESQKEQIKKLVESGNTLKAQKIILRELGKEFGGAAKAAAQPSEKAAASYHQLQDMVGSVTVPVMNRLYNIFSNKLAPILLKTGEKYLPAVRKSLLDLLKGDNVNRMLARTGDVLERAGRIVSRIDLGSVFDKLKNVDTRSASTSLSSLADSAKELGPVFKDFIHQLPGINDILSVTATAFGFLADHTGLLRKAMPLLVGAFVAYKAVQLAANVAAAASLPTKIAEVVVNRQLIASNRALIASREGLVAATVQGTAAENVGILTRIRSTVVTVATTVASKAAAAASRAWAAAQVLLSAAMSANPIGLVVIAIVALVAGLVYAYRHSERFRAVVQAVFGFVAKYVPKVVSAVVDFIRNHWRTIITIIGGPIGLAVALVSKHWDKIKAGAQAVINWVRNNWPAIKALVTAPFETAKRTVGAVWTSLRQGASRVKEVVTGVFNAIKDAIQGAIDKVQALIDKLAIANKAKGNAVKGAENPREEVNGRTPGRVMMDRLTRDIVRGGNVAAKAAKGAGAKIKQALQDQLDLKTADYDRFKSVFDSLKDTVAEAFKGDLFSSTSGADFLKNAQGVISNLTDATTARVKLLASGASTNFVTSLFSSGNIDLIRSLVSGPADIVQQASAQFSQTNKLADQLSDDIAKNSNFEGKVLGPALDNLAAEVKRLTDELQAAKGGKGNSGVDGGRGGNDDDGKGGKGGRGGRGGRHRTVNNNFTINEASDGRLIAHEAARQLAFAGG